MSTRRAVAKYTLSRLGVFAAVLVLLYLVGLRGPSVILIAVVLSGITSLFLLQRQRTVVASHVEGMATRRRVRSAGRAAREDEIADRLIAEEQQQQTRP